MRAWNLQRKVLGRQRRKDLSARGKKDMTFRCIAWLVFFLLFPGFGSAAASATGTRWKTLQKDGIHWLVTPEGKLFYSKGVNIVSGWEETPKTRLGHAFYWGDHYPTLDAWRESARTRLQAWGFNTLGGWSDPSALHGIPLTVDLELGRNSRFHWYDPFDPGMDEKAFRVALELTEPYRNNPHLVGYYSDNEVGWWNTPLFQWFLAASPRNHTRQVLLKLVHEHYEGDWQRFLEDWVPQGNEAGFEDLEKAGVKLKLRPGGHGIHLVNRFMHRVAARYYELMFNAIRRAHPEALVLGDRLPLYYHQDAVLAMGDNLDVISTNYNVDVPDGWVAPYYFEGLQRLSKKPVLVTEFFFAAHENRSGNRNETAGSQHSKPGHLMTVSTQAARAWGAGNAALNFSRFPNVVGAHWFQYYDEPLGGREDGEDYNMGLIDTADRPYEKLTQAFTRINPALELYHRTNPGAPIHSARRDEHPPSGSTPETDVHLPKARFPIDVRDQSLMDWDKQATRLSGFKTPEPYVPFGDIHLTWTDEGLHLACIANTYVEPSFLDSRGEFPASEAFQIHLFVEAAGVVHQFSVCLLPQTDPALPDGFDIVPRLFRNSEGGGMESLPAEGYLQRIEKSLPHMMVEAFFPAEWFGLKRLEAGMHVRMNIVMSNYFRELTMTWAGRPTIEDAARQDSLKTVVLKDGRDGTHTDAGSPVKAESPG